MKKFRSFFAAMLFFILPAGLQAQDPVHTCPNVYKKVLLNNEQVRIIEIEFKPGDVADWHTHPNHTAYALTEAKLEIAEKGKAPVVAELKAGEVIYIPAITHKAKNIGSNTVRMIVTEIKSSTAAR